jgi:predicted membrane GTPase involved in stress response
MRELRNIQSSPIVDHGKTTLVTNAETIGVFRENPAVVERVWTQTSGA